MPRSATRVKTYPVSQSPLFKLKSRGKLARLLDCNRRDLEKLANRSDNYTVFTKMSNIRTPRVIEKPRPRLEAIHRKIFNWLRSIEHPPYLHSGVQGRSYITNAKAHVGAARMFTLDIRKFFPSTKGQHVYEFFNAVMLCSPDVSAVLTKLCTVNGHVPTGSCVSQEIAFWAHCRMFDAMYALAQTLGLKMTCYVDDITISGHRANKSSLHTVRSLLVKRSLASHPQKERTYYYRRPGLVTGTIVGAEGLFLPNSKHEQLHEKLDAIQAMGDDQGKLTMIVSAIGMVVAASQLDGRVTPRLRALVQERRRVQRVLSSYGHALTGGR